ncbi:hypothetical protein F503_05422 [Ophiostoma piceae UAMH 11346]|uniref:Store-operated calcium entry-associated regulatory factor n=1 Tax=Ophiostoma piceae (strain UAMH 11346) TaxID=1262450 RepID=S3CBR5_OPHP1|nr:hypothetical protein F503_05422 [Ophiostoma piceae UAMH 11346]
MHLNPWSLLAVGLAGLAAVPSAAAAAKPKNAILLSKVQSLTLRDGKMTTHRRVPTIPQLKCTASPQRVCDLYTIDTMRCTNQGSGYDDEDIQWSCTASLPPELKLGGTEVVCEGYSSSDDRYVLKGSCAVEYRLLLTDYGEEKYPDLAKGDGLFNNIGSNKSSWLFWIIFVAIAAWIIWGAFGGNHNQNAGGNGRPGGGGGGGFWGGGGGGFDPGNDPPPPYPGTKPSDQQQQWRPGFWTGLAGGAAAGYAAGGRNTNFQRGYYDRDYGTGGGYGGGRSGWGGGSGSPGPSTRPVSSARNPSTGFGSTSRR